MAFYYQSEWPDENDIIRWLLHGGTNPFNTLSSESHQVLNKNECNDTETASITAVFIALHTAANKLHVNLSNLPFDEVDSLVNLLIRDTENRIDSTPSQEITEALLSSIISKI